MIATIQETQDELARRTSSELCGPDVPDPDGLLTGSVAHFAVRREGHAGDDLTS